MQDAYLEHGSTRLPQSYADELGLFSTSFVYDCALTTLAYLSYRSGPALQRARSVGDALLWAQAHDPDYGDGRLRQAYNVGPYTFYDGSYQPDGLVRSDGKANVGWQFGFTGTFVGDMAWAGVALCQLADRTGDRPYLDGAVRIGEWIVDRASTTQPLRGYRLGVNAADELRPETSTEHNIDVVAFFRLLARQTGDRRWLSLAEPALDFVLAMWEPAGGFFYTGSDDGSTINRFPIPLDTQTWSYLALEDPAYAGSLDWAAENLAAADDPSQTNSTLQPGQRFAGLTFSTASLVADVANPIAPFQPKPNRQGVWFEGTAQQACALRARDQADEDARDHLVTLARAQDQLGAGQHAGGTVLPERAGVVAASSPIDTGFKFGYYPYRHTGATAWFVMAYHAFNPYRPLTRGGRNS